LSAYIWLLVPKKAGTFMSKNDTVLLIRLINNEGGMSRPEKLK
jgi:hypothetical protein